MVRAVCLVNASDNERGDHTWLVTLNADGSNVQKIPMVKLRINVYGTPVPLPDGRHIGIMLRVMSMRPHAAPDHWEIATLDIQTSTVKHIAEGMMPHWSPDGKTIVYTVVTKEDPQSKLRTYQLWTMNADGKNARAIAPEGTCNASFSPDGKQIAYVGIDDHHTNLFVSDADGKNAHKLTTIPAVYASPRWLPDSSGIVFAAGKHLVRAANSANAPAKTKTPGKTKGAQPKAKGASAKAKAKAAQHNSETGEGPSQEKSFDEMRPDTIFVITPDGSSMHPISPRLAPPSLPSDKPSTVCLDEDAIESIRLGMKPRVVPQVTRKSKNETKAASVPAGHTVTFQGTKVFLRDASGKLTPMPDGYYQLPNGMKIFVRDGMKTRRDFSDGDDD